MSPTSMMKPQRNSIRLRGYDYRKTGAYFCTLCVHRQLRRRAVWGRVINGEMHLNRFGKIVQDCWMDLPNHHDGVVLDAFQVMPNHVHAIIHLTGDAFDEPRPAAFGPLSSGSLSVVIGSFKAAVTRQISRSRNARTLVWQPRFYERIIRAENECDAFRLYIGENPPNWPHDRCHPAHPEFEKLWAGTAPDNTFYDTDYDTEM